MFTSGLQDIVEIYILFAREFADDWVTAAELGFLPQWNPQAQKLWRSFGKFLDLVQHRLVIFQADLIPFGVLGVVFFFFAIWFSPGIDDMQRSVQAADKEKRFT